jgi:hypothetical protein
MKERRNIRRWEIQPFIPLFNVETDDILGYIADLSNEGILLFSTDPIEFNKIFSLYIRLEDLRNNTLDENITEERISFQVESRWVDLEVKPFFNRTGLMFVNLSPEVHDIIAHLIDNIADMLAWGKLDT